MARRPLAFLLTMVILSTSAFADVAPPASAPAAEALAKMPVKEVTIFKDGHALMLHAGKMPTDGAGNVLLDDLPAPVLGTFWPYSGDANVKLTAVTAGQRKVSVEHTTLSIPELIHANIGARVIVRTGDNQDYEGTIANVLAKDVAVHDVPDASGGPNEGSPPTPPPSTPDNAPLLLKMGTGVKVIPLNQVSSLLLVDAQYKTTISTEESRNLLTLKLQWPNGKPQAEADVGMMYLQKGLRWIPSYKVTIDGKGQATFQLQGTLVNEITDLKDVKANLVIGVPTFAFAGEPDPMGLQKALVQLSPYFQRDARSRYGLSNAMMSQAPQQADESAQQGSGGGPDPEVTGSAKNEDLFVFTVDHITLKKGDRMVVPITSFTVPYTDVYTLDIPFTPPPEIWHAFATQQQAEVARLYHAPRVMHTLRITDTSDYPITTAPALLMEEGKVLAQSMTLYTSKKGTLDLPVTAAVDIAVKKSDHEVKRTPNAVRWEGDDYARIDLQGSIVLSNHRDVPAVLEIKRSMLGQVDTADNDGKADMLNLFEDDSFLPAGTEDQPTWWGWYSWPSWWSHFNGIGQVTWKATLDPGKDLTLNYTWHYFWR